MDRSRETIINTDREQANLDLPHVLSVSRAIEVASAFDVVANILQTQLDSPVNEDLDGGSLDRGESSKWAKKYQRLVLLRSYSSGILNLCAPEIAERAISNLQLPR